MKKALLILGVIVSIPLFLFVTATVLYFFFAEVFVCSVNGFNDPEGGCNSALYYLAFSTGLVLIEIYVGFVVVSLMRKLKKPIQVIAFADAVADTSSENTKTSEPVHKLSFLTFIPSGLPLIGYPVLLLFSSVELGAPIDGEPFLLLLVPLAFIWGSLLYPFVYIFCIIAFFVTDSDKKKLLFLKIPPWHLFACAGLFFAWILVGFLAQLLGY